MNDYNYVAVSPTGDCLYYYEFDKALDEVMNLLENIFCGKENIELKISRDNTTSPYSVRIYHIIPNFFEGYDKQFICKINAVKSNQNK